MRTWLFPSRDSLCSQFLAVKSIMLSCKCFSASGSQQGKSVPESVPALLASLRFVQLLLVLPVATAPERFELAELLADLPLLALLLTVSLVVADATPVLVSVQVVRDMWRSVASRRHDVAFICRR